MDMLVGKAGSQPSWLPGPASWMAANPLVVGLAQLSTGSQGSHPGDLPNPGMKPVSPVMQADSLLPEAPGKPFTRLLVYNKKV